MVAGVLLIGVDTGVQARPVCDLVSEQDAVAVLGLVKKKNRILAAQGDTVWSFGVEHVYNKDLSDTLPKLRVLSNQIQHSEFSIQHFLVRP